MQALLQHRLSRQAERRPDAPAVVMAGQHLSFAELEVLSNRLAWQLKAAGCRPGERVCFLLPKSPLAIVAMMGILKADAIYVPLDPDSPPARLAKMVQRCRPALILAAGKVIPLLNALLENVSVPDEMQIGWLSLAPPDGNIFPVAFLRPDLDAYPETPPPAHNTPRDAAYILFTSGSTGIPKGVVITHENVQRLVDWGVNYFGITPEDQLSGHSPLHFDLSVFDIFAALTAGATLHLVPPALNLLPNQLAAFIRRSGLTQWFSVPSVLNYLAQMDGVKPHDFPALRRLLWCGEVLPTPALRYWMQRLPHVQFTNLYGPTETTVASSYYTVPVCPASPTAEIPIGRPCAGEELYVLDDQLKPVAPGQVGTLYIGGVGLSPGYWEDAPATARAFLPYTPPGGRPGRIYNTGDRARQEPDGRFYFHGRADEQVKSRGYRIELGEIETALHALDYLRESAVVAVDQGGFQGATICCAYAPQAHRAVTPLILRRDLARALPSYMLPTRWLALETLPQNGNGKVDRRKLKNLFEHHP